MVAKHTHDCIQNVMHKYSTLRSKNIAERNIV